jgi:hypothetical protein
MAKKAGKPPEEVKRCKYCGAVASIARETCGGCSETLLWLQNIPPEAVTKLFRDSGLKLKLSFGR